MKIKLSEAYLLYELFLLFLLLDNYFRYGP
jgi:hypothetical protein